MRGHISVDQVYRQVAEHIPTSTSPPCIAASAGQRGFLPPHFHYDRARHRADRHPHGHLVCRVCGVNQELDLSVLEPLESDLRRRYGFEADLSHTAIVGVCRGCGGRPKATLPST